MSLRICLCHVGIQLSIEACFSVGHVCIQFFVQLLLGQCRASAGTSASTTASKVPSSPTYPSQTSTTDSTTTHSCTPSVPSPGTSTTWNSTTS